MLTNCGLLSPRWYTNCQNIRPSITGQHIPYFHSMLCEWAYNISLNFFWVIVIDAQQKNHLLNSIVDVAQLEPRYKGKWEVTDREVNALFNEQTQDTIGCIFADSVRVPGESVTIQHFGGSQRNNGNLKSPAITNRSDLTPLEIGFRETNLSFTDFFLRPWSIITGYKGLISDDGSLRSPSNASYWGGSIKSNIHLYQLAKNGTTGNPCNESVVRKEYHFYDACPIKINDDELSQDSSGINKRQVSFTYNYYSVAPGRNV